MTSGSRSHLCLRGLAVGNFLASRSFFVLDPLDMALDDLVQAHSARTQILHPHWIKHEPGVAFLSLYQGG